MRVSTTPKLIVSKPVAGFYQVQASFEIDFEKSAEKGDVVVLSELWGFDPNVKNVSVLKNAGGQLVHKQKNTEVVEFGFLVPETTLKSLGIVDSKKLHLKVSVYELGKLVARYSLM